MLSLPDWTDKIIIYDFKNQKTISIAESAKMNPGGTGFYTERLQLQADNILIPLLKELGNSNRLMLRRFTDWPLLADIYINDYTGGKACRIDASKKQLSLLSGNMLLNMTYDGDSIKILQNLVVTGQFTSIDFESNLLITAVSKESQVYNIFTISPAKRLMNVSFTDSKVRFETNAGQYAEFFTIDNDQHLVTDIIANRPDMILSMLNHGATKLISLYNKVVELRLKKVFQSDINSINPDSAFLTLQQEDLPPKTSFVGEHFDKVIKGSDSLTVRFEHGQHAEGIDRFNIWINGVPQFGEDGIAPGAADSSVIARTILLSQGSNRIQVALRTSSLMWGPKDSWVCHYLPIQPRPSQTYFFGIGMSAFSDSTRNLKAADKDIIEMAKQLKNRLGEYIEINTLINDKEGIKAPFRNFKSKLAKTSPDDKIIIMLSGHGILCQKNLLWAFPCYNTDFNKPDTAECITYDDINKLLQDIPARKRLIIIDACHAGQSFFDYAWNWKNGGNNAFDKQGQMAVKDGGQTHAELPFKVADNFAHFEPAKDFLPLDYEAFKIITEAFPDDNQNGSTVITASRGEQTAKEDEENGLLTRAMLDMMNSNMPGTVSINKLIEGLKANFTNEYQKPSLKSYNPVFDWIVW